MPGKYAKPDGRLLLALDEHAAAGCVAMRKLVPGIAEMKRLYVRPAFQGSGIGRRLIEMIINEASQSGYSKLRLDTHPPKMGKAVRLYESHGFHPIPPYYVNPHSNVLFMELSL